MLTIVRTDSGHTDFRNLVLLLDRELQERDGEDHAFFAQFNTIEAIKQVVVAYSDGVPVGCGAIKAYAAEVVEVKRMFVLPQYRRHGIAARVLQELESWAHELSFTGLVLETGYAQPEAIGLYKKSGYRMIPNYGQYAGVEKSVCFQKTI